MKQFPKTAEKRKMFNEKRTKYEKVKDFKMDVFFVFLFVDYMLDLPGVTIYITVFSHSPGWIF